MGRNTHGYYYIQFKMKIKYFNKGGQFPYQAEGVIDNKHYFYFRARHNTIQLEIYKSREDLDTLKDSIYIVNQEIKDSCLNDKQAHKLIIKLYKIIK